MYNTLEKEKQKSFNKNNTLSGLGSMKSINAINEQVDGQLTFDLQQKSSNVNDLKHIDEFEASMLSQEESNGIVHNQDLQEVQTTFQNKDPTAD